LVTPAIDSMPPTMKRGAARGDAVDVGAQRGVEVLEVLVRLGLVDPHGQQPT
jgi:hypothetical protein